jgi:hypothetical protein
LTNVRSTFFDELGSPGGAHNIGITENDPPAARRLPPMGDLNRAHSRKARIIEILRGEMSVATGSRVRRQFVRVTRLLSMKYQTPDRNRCAGATRGWGLAL